MDLKALPGVIVLFVLMGTLLAVGLTVLGAFESSNALSKVVDYENFTMPTSKNGSVSLANGNLTTGTLVVKNQTGSVFDTGNYSVDLVGGRLTMLQQDNTTCKTGAVCQAYYTFKDYTLPSVRSVQAAEVGVSEMPNNWFLIMVIVIAASVVIGTIFNYLKPGQR